MLDDFMKEEFKIKSQKVAETFTMMFIAFIVVHIILVFLLFKSICPFHDKFFQNRVDQVYRYTGIDSKGLIVSKRLFQVNALITVFFFGFMPFLLIFILDKYYSRKQSKA